MYRLISLLACAGLAGTLAFHPEEALAASKSPDVMLSSTGAESVSAVWGPIPMLIGSWLQDGAVVEFRWLRVGEVLEQTIENATVSVAITYRLNPEGTAIDGLAKVQNVQAYRVELESPRPGVLVTRVGNLRDVDQFENGKRWNRQERLQAGIWTEFKSEEPERLDAVKRAAILSRFVDVRAAQARAIEAKLAEEESVWGLLPYLADSFWRGSEETWYIRKTVTEDMVGILGHVTKGVPVYQIIRLRNDGSRVGGNMLFYRDDRRISLGRWGEYQKDRGRALVLEGRDAFEWTPGKMSGDIFVPGPNGKNWGRGRFVRMSPSDGAAFDKLVAEKDRLAKLAEAQKAQSSGGGLLGGLGRMVQGAVAGAAGMASGGGGYDAAIAGAAAGAVAGAAGVEAGSINQGFREGAADVNARNAEMEAQMAANQARIEDQVRRQEQAKAATSQSGTGNGSATGIGSGGAMTVANSAPAPQPAPSAQAPALGRAPTVTSVASAPKAPAAAEMCTTPGGTREWSTGGLTSLKDAQASYEQEAAFQRSRGASMGPMHPSGKVITVFGEPSANYAATITYPARTTRCGSRVSGQ